jgi:organic radical activating enzyme
MNKFCLAPENGLTIFPNGRISPCCAYDDIEDAMPTHPKDLEAYLNDSSLKNVIHKQETQNQHPGCNKCISKEHFSNSSQRQLFNQYQPFSPGIKHLDLSLSNLCNLKCRMCDSMLSTSWQKDDQLLGRPVFKHNDFSVNWLIANQKHLQNLQTIEMKGGEPFMHNGYEDFLKAFESNLPNISLRLTTNGTTIPSWINELKKFKKVRISVSFEGTDEIYQYIRGGKYSFQDFETNFKELLKIFKDAPHVEFKPMFTFQIYNVWNFPLAWQWAQQFKNQFQDQIVLERFTNIVFKPAYLNPQLIPQFLRLEILNELEPLDQKNLKNYINLMISSDIQKTHLLLAEFNKFTLILDQSRGENLIQVEPRFQRLFDFTF